MPAGRSTELRRLSEANTEPGSQTISGVVRVLNLVLGPLTERDWRRQDKLPQTGGLIIAANHISNVDPLALGQFVAYSGRWPRFLAKNSLFRGRLLGRLLTAAGQIPVERTTGKSRDALQAAREAIEAGRAVVIYPEGTITRDPDLWPMRAKTGVVRLALETGCPIIPVGQWGAQDIMWGPRLELPKVWPRKTLQVLVGDPVPLDDLRGAPISAAVLTLAADRVMTAITALVAELRDEPPPATRYDPRPDPLGAGQPEAPA
jgi:1-acyl-sn-glycerol-3-phosphate acyltransferase